MELEKHTWSQQYQTRAIDLMSERNPESLFFFIMKTTWYAQRHRHSLLQHLITVLDFEVWELKVWLPDALDGWSLRDHGALHSGHLAAARVSQALELHQVQPMQTTLTSKPQQRLSMEITTIIHTPAS
jgi:hypothetical protein